MSRAAETVSYTHLIKIARDLPISDELSPMILKAAVRTSPSIPEYIRSCEMNAFRSAQKTEQKDTVPQSRPCELRIYQVTETEQKNCFSVTCLLYTSFLIPAIRCAVDLRVKLPVNQIEDYIVGADCVPACFLARIFARD